MDDWGEFNVCVCVCVYSFVWLCVRFCHGKDTHIFMHTWCICASVCACAYYFSDTISTIFSYIFFIFPLSFVSFSQFQLQRSGWNCGTGLSKWQLCQMQLFKFMPCFRRLYSAFELTEILYGKLLNTPNYFYTQMMNTHICITIHVMTLTYNIYLDISLHFSALPACKIHLVYQLHQYPSK